MAERAEERGVIPAQLTAPSGWQVLPVLRRMAAMPLRDPFAFTGLLIYVLFALVALFADQLAPLDPMEILFTKAGKLAANLGPGADFPLGTTNLGRDIYAQLIHGTRSALAVGLSAAVIVATVGTIVGLVAG
jgi:peptide/nickel transport system permease protein